MAYANNGVAIGVKIGGKRSVLCINRNLVHSYISHSASVRNGEKFEPWEPRSEHGFTVIGHTFCLVGLAPESTASATTAPDPENYPYPNEMWSFRVVTDETMPAGVDAICGRANSTGRNGL